MIVTNSTGRRIYCDECGDRIMPGRSHECEEDILRRENERLCAENAAKGARIAELERQEMAHLSELADYGRTVGRLNRAVSAVREYFVDNADNWAMEGSMILGDALAGKEGSRD